MATNRLSESSSLYLQQHAENPVDWWPWCEEAFEVAKKENKPVLVSIGYASCHWCHVMAHECFEDPYIADLMNRHFINIKVDREERPEIDQIYMEAVQMLNQSGGWPLNVFCMPDKRPFTGGTYFPADDKGNGVVPWPHFLMRVSETYQHDSALLEKNAEAIVSNLAYLSGSVLEEDREWDDSMLFDGAKMILESFDEKFGGFGGAPKFPPSQMMGYLYAVRNNDRIDVELKENIDHVLQRCSHALVRSGLFDHVDGGFYRYSVDAEWRVPHFEKMLYDNALIIEVLSKTWSRYRWEGTERAVRKTVRFLEREFMRGIHPGVFASSMDADSEAGEGAYYLWSEAELRECIPSTEIEAFLEGFSIRGKDPLNLYPWSLSDEQYRGFTMVLNDLHDIRNERSSPTLDPKVILSWNALLLRSLTVAGYIFEERAWLKTVQDGLDWIWEHSRRENGSLASVYYTGNEGAISGGDGYLDDYVNLALANVHFAMIGDLIEPGISEIYLNRAIELGGIIVDKFADESPDGEGFFYCTEADASSLVVRKKEWYDNAYPCGNSSVVHLISLLSAIDASPAYAGLLEHMRSAFVERGRRVPNGIAFGMEGLSWEAQGVAVLKIGSGVDRNLVWKALVQEAWQPVWVVFSSELEADQLQVCLGQQCHVPVSSIEAALKVIF